MCSGFVHDVFVPKSALRQRTALTVIAAAAMAATTTLLPAPANAALIDVAWRGGAGNWGDAANWNPSVVPSNTATDTYKVRIDSITGPSNVTLDRAVLIDDLALGADSRLDMPGHGMNLNGSLSNAGTISVVNTAIVGGMNTTIGGAGTILMSGPSAVLSPGTGTLTIGPEQTVRGQGAIVRIGEPLRAAIVNRGLIDAQRASSADAVLVVDPVNNDVAFANHGTMQSSGAFGVLFLGSGTYDNSDGTIQSIAIGSETPDVFIQRNSQLSGGTLATRGSAGASLRMDSGVTINNATLVSTDGSTMRASPLTISNSTFTTSSGGTVMLLNAGSLTPTLTDCTNNGMLRLGQPAAGSLSSVSASAILRGTFTNNGSVAFASFGDPSLAEALHYSGDVHLAGNGTVTMISGPWNSIDPASPNDTLTNDAGHTIDGVGQIFGKVTNEGLLNMRRVGASGASAIFGDLVNKGTIQAQPNATLDMRNLSSSRNDGTIQSAGGFIQTSGDWTGSGQWIANGGTVQLIAGTLGTSGPLAARNNGMIDIGADVTGVASVSIESGGSIVVNSNLRSIGDVSMQGASRLLLQPGTTLVATGVAIDAGGGSLDLRGATVTTPKIVTAGDGASVVNTSGNSSVQSIGGDGATRVLSGSLTADHFRQRTLQVDGRAIVRPNGTDGGASRVGDLLIGAAGAFDLNDNDLVATTTSLSNVRGAIVSARKNGAWNGPGITSSAAAANASHATTLGVLGGDEYLAVAGHSFAGFDVAGSDVLVKYTWYGDTDFNGVVNFDDYVRTDNGFNNHQSGWLNGDFDLNGTVNFDDYVLIDLAFNTQSGTLGRALAFLDGSDRSTGDMTSPGLQQVVDHFGEFGASYASGFVASVPEPVSLASVSALGTSAAMLRRRRRKHVVST